jgi:hypothetical protein
VRFPTVPKTYLLVTTFSSIVGKRYLERFWGFLGLYAMNTLIGYRSLSRPYVMETLSSEQFLSGQYAIDYGTLSGPYEVDTLSSNEVLSGPYAIDTLTLYLGFK